MTYPCAAHPSHQILLICLQEKCEESRLCCLLCADQHHVRHQLISIRCFHNLMENNLQINRKNQDKLLILKELNKCKADVMNRLQIAKNKLIGLVGECEDKVEQYFSKIFHSFAVDPHQMLIKDIETHFNSQKVSKLIKMMKDFQNITLGSVSETQSIMYACLAVFKEKIKQVQKSCQTQLESLRDSWNQVSFAKPKDFLYQFSKDKRQGSFLSLSDSQTSVIRTNGTGGYPMCLAAMPFNPINNSVVFKIDKTQGYKKTICLGACLQNVVRSSNFANCGGGSNKGIYAIDQNCPYNSQEGMMASWNHHDPEFNQSNVGNSNIVGWKIQEGDEIRVTIDYYNSNIIFVNGDGQDWGEDEDESKVYEMPVKLNAGPIYAFISCQNKGDMVTIKP